MNHKHARTLEKIFQHPISNDIHWNDVMKLLEGIGAEITVNKNSGKTLVNLEGHQCTLPSQTHKVLSNHKEVMDLRHFLTSAGFSP